MKLRSVKSKSGAVMAEFAAVLPVFLLLFVGLLEFGWLLHVKQSMSIAAREGVRVLATHNGTSGDAEEAAQNFLNSANVDGSEVVAVDATSGDSVTLTITVPWSDNSLTGGAFGVLMGVGDLEVTMTMRKEYEPEVVEEEGPLIPEEEEPPLEPPA